MEKYVGKNISELREIILAKQDYISKTQLDVFEKEIPTSIKWFNIALTNMVHSNINAFIILSDVNNFYAARAIIRMQLNCLMKLFSIFIIVPQEKWIYKMLFEEDSWNTKIRYNGKPKNLTDTFLAEQLHNNKVLLNSRQLYKYYSKFIHPSNQHFTEAVTKWDAENGKVEWATMININGITKLSEDEIKNCFINFLIITDKIGELLSVSCNRSQYKTYQLS